MGHVPQTAVSHYNHITTVWTDVLPSPLLQKYRQYGNGANDADANTLGNTSTNAGSIY